MLRFFKLSPWRNLFIPIALVFISLVTYINILPNQLFYDDEELIYKNTYVKDLRLFSKYFTENMIAGAGKLSNMYRPILLTSYALDYQIWGNHPAGYHLTSIILHTTNSILIFFLIKHLFVHELLAILTSLFFLVHPVQTETVVYASGRTDLLYTFFALLSLIIFLNFLNSTSRRLFKYLTSIISFLLSFLAKETAIILPFLVLLITFASLKKTRISLGKIFSLVLPFFTISGIYIILRLTILNFTNTLNFYPTSNTYSQNLSVRLLTFTRVFFEYLLVLIYPQDLVFARKVPIITTFIDPYVLGFTLLVVILTVISLIKFSKNRLFLFTIIWFFICILPVSGIIPINSMIAEHFLYLPSASYFLIFAYFLNMLYQKSSKFSMQPVFIIGVIIITTLFIVRSIIRTFDWRNPIIFYTKSIQQSPWHITMRHNLAMTYAIMGNSDLAIQGYKSVISLADVYPNAHHNLGLAYSKLGRFKEAEEEYKKALELDSQFFFSYYALLDLYKKIGSKDKYDQIVVKLKLQSVQSKFDNLEASFK